MTTHCSSPSLWAHRWYKPQSLLRMSRPAITFLSSEDHCPSTIAANYTAWWQRQVCVSGLSRAVLYSTVGESQTCDLSITSPTFCNNFHTTSTTHTWTHLVGACKVGRRPISKPVQSRRLVVDTALRHARQNGTFADPPALHATRCVATRTTYATHSWKHRCTDSQALEGTVGNFGWDPEAATWLSR